MRPWKGRLSPKGDRHQGSALRHLFLVAGLAASSVGAEAAVLELTAGRDNTLFADGDLSSGAGPALFAGNTGAGSARRAMFLFEIAGQLPPDSRVDSVTVTLQVTNSPNDFPRRFTLHRIRRDWGESASIAGGGAGASAEIGDATWRDAFYPGQRWSSAGGDFEPIASSTQTVGGVGSCTWRGLALTTDVNAWLAQPGSNFGWLLAGEEIGLNTARRFASREAGEALARPTITIHYTPAAVARSNSWGSVKARYR